MNEMWSGAALVIAYGIVLIVGLALIAAALLSLLRSFSAGSRTRPPDSAGRVLSRAVSYSLGLGAVVFGIVGLVARLVLRVAPGPSVLWSLGAGLLVAFIAQAVLVYLPNRNRVEEAAVAVDAEGREAQVVIPVPANGLGEVAYREGTARVNLGARSAAGQPIPQGEVVLIERVVNRVAIVRPVNGVAGANGHAGRRPI
jgi:hypothetical protein